MNSTNAICSSSSTTPPARWLTRTNLKMVNAAHRVQMAARKMRICDAENPLVFATAFNIGFALGCSLPSDDNTKPSIPQRVIGGSLIGPLIGAALIMTYWSTAFSVEKVAGGVIGLAKFAGIETDQKMKLPEIPRSWYRDCN